MLMLHKVVDDDPGVRLQMCAGSLDNVIWESDRCDDLDTPIRQCCEAIGVLQADVHKMLHQINLLIP